MTQGSKMTFTGRQLKRIADQHSSPGSAHITKNGRYKAACSCGESLGTFLHDDDYFGAWTPVAGETMWDRIRNKHEAHKWSAIAKEIND